MSCNMYCHGDPHYINHFFQDFQNEMSGKQPEIDQLTKSDRRRTTSMSGGPVSHIPMFKGLSGRRTPVKFGSLR